MDQKNKLKQIRLQGNEALKNDLRALQEIYIEIQAHKNIETKLIEKLSAKVMPELIDVINFPTGGKSLGPKCDFQKLYKHKEFKELGAILESTIKAMKNLEAATNLIEEKYRVNITAFALDSLPLWEPAGAVRIIKNEFVFFRNFRQAEESGQFDFAKKLQKAMDERIVKNGKLKIEIDLTEDNTPILEKIDSILTREKKKRGLAKAKGKPKSAYHANKQDYFIEIFLKYYCNSALSTVKAINKANEELQKKGINFEITSENFNRRISRIIRKRKGVSDIRHLRKQDN